MIKYAVITSALLAFFSGCHLRARSKVAEKVAFHDDLNYSATKDKDAGLDLYVPKDASVKTPAAIFIHGGYWRNQTRSYYQTFTGLYQNVGLALAKRGIATAVIDYRLYPRANCDEQIADVAQATAFVKQNAALYNIDPTRIYLVGHSAGGHLALMVSWARKNTDVRGVVALSPILDIGHMRANKEADFNKELTVPFFGTGENDKKYSPAEFATPDAAAALLLFGSKDYAYLIEQSRLYKENFSAKALKQIQFETVADVDHSAMVMDLYTADDKISDLIARFVTKTGDLR